METNDVVKELGTKITIPKGIKEAVYDKLFKNLCMAGLVLLYFIFVNLGYIKLNPNVFEGDLHVFAGILIILTIVSFEMGYRRNNIEMSMHGMELLFLSIVTLFMPYIYFHRGLILRFAYSFAAIYVMVYYFIKCAYIYMNEIRKYKSGLSDIKELVDDEEEETYLDKPNERKFKDVEEEEAPKSTLARMLEKPKKAVKKVSKSVATKKVKNEKEDKPKEKKVTKKTTAKKATGEKKARKDETKNEEVKKTTTRKKTKKDEMENDEVKKTTTRKRTKKDEMENDEVKKTTTEKKSKTTRKKKEDKEG